MKNKKTAGNIEEGDFSSRWAKRRAAMKEPNLKALQELIKTCGSFRDVFESVFQEGLDDDQMLAFLSQFDLGFVVSDAKDVHDSEVEIQRKGREKFNKVLSAGLSYNYKVDETDAKRYLGESVQVYSFSDIYEHKELLGRLRSSLLSCRSSLVSQAVSSSLKLKD